MVELTVDAVARIGLLVGIGARRLLFAGAAPRLIGAAVLAILLSGWSPGPAAAQKRISPTSPLLTGSYGDVARIASPAQPMLVSGRSARVVVRLRRTPAEFRAWLGRRDVSERFLRAGRGRRVALLPRRLMRRGANDLAVRTRAGGERDFDHMQLIVARRDRRLVRVALAGRGTKRARRQDGTLRVRLRFSTGLDGLRVRLGGRNVTARFRRGARGASAALAVDDGLRFGRNRLVVVAWTKDGRWDGTRRRLVVHRRAPLPAAGRDRVLRVGTRARLDAGAARPAGGGRLAYRWRLVQAPGASMKSLRGAAGRRASLVPKRPGRYRLRLTVTERGRRGQTAVDELIVDAAPNLPPMGAGFATMLPNRPEVGGGTAIGIGLDTDEERFYGPIPPDKPFMLVLDRATLQPPSDVPPQPLPSGQAGWIAWTAISRDLANRPQHYLAILVGRPGCCAGMSSPFRNDGFSFITRVGEGPVFQNPGRVLGDGLPPGFTYGYLQKDISHRYTPVSHVYPSYATSDDQSNPNRPAGGITVASGRSAWEEGRRRTYTGSVGGNEAGFIVATLDRGTLEPVGPAPRAYRVNSSPDVQAAEQSAMNTALNDAADLDRLVIIQSIGRPRPTTPNWAGIAAQIEKLGGSGHVFNTLGGSRYAFIGCSGCEHAVESSPTLSQNQDAGHLSGVLARDAFFGFAPLLGAEEPGLDYSLLPLAYEVPGRWPAGKPGRLSPGGNSPGERQALAWVAKQVFDELKLKPGSGWCYTPAAPDVRALYCDVLGLDKLKTTVAQVQYKDGMGFDRDAFESVQAELVLEISDVQGVNDLLIGSQSLQAALKDQKSDIFPDTKGIGEAVKAQLNAAPSGKQPVAILEYLNQALEVVSAFAPEEAEGVQVGITVLTTLLSIGAQTDSAGDEVTVPGDQAASELTNRLDDLADQFALLQPLLVSDYHKLDTASSGVLSQWSKDAPTQREIGRQLRLASRQWAWLRLLPSAFYSTRWAPPPAGKRINDMWCRNNRGDKTRPAWQPFGPLSDNASWTPIDHFDGSMNPRYSAWWAPGNNIFSDVRILPGRLFDNLWSPPADNDLSRAGWAKPLFFRDAVWREVDDFTDWPNHPDPYDWYRCYMY
ncbi:MAG: hypothetical protein ICV69_09065 [Thermoleophilaceae bacterium]|nr:hypothetical protein [Thermoleophilaceae bacterium]